jgi:hypothetical protein
MRKIYWNVLYFLLVTGGLFECSAQTQGEFFRTIVGLEQAGASASDSARRFFFDLYLSTPFPTHQEWDDDFGPRVRLWGNVRITSVPQQISSTIGSFAVAFPQQIADLKVNEVAQAAEFLAGTEIRIPHMTLKSKSGNQKFSLHLVAGGGIITPLTPKDTLQVFSIAPGTLAPEQRVILESLYPQVVGKTEVAFVTADRDRFFRQFYAGFRLKTNYPDDDNGNPRFPAFLDITYGQNESVTGGRLRGGVLRLEGFFPLPYEKVKFLYLFGTALLKPSRTKITDPLILQPPDPNIQVPSEQVAMVTVSQANRDYYRIGIGIDFIEFVKAIKQLKPTQ